MSVEKLFERIAAGDIPSYEVYSDEDVFAFLDINPLSRGHTLVIPRKRSTTVDELPDETAAALGRALPRIARAVKAATGAAAYNILCNNGRASGQEIPHVHFHIIPKYADGSGLPHHWPAGKLDEVDAEALRQRIKGELEDG
ncbi:MAG: HIT family protein [Phycisphaerales bacterium]